MRRWTRSVSLAWALAVCACTASPSRPDDPVSLARLEAQRVQQILQARHPSHAPLDAELGTRVLDQLRLAFDPVARCVSARMDLDGERIANALERGEIDFVATVGRACTGRAPPAAEARERAFVALARAYDPYCNYLSAEALRQRRLQARTVRARPARGRLVEHAGRQLALIELSSFYLSTERSAADDVLYLARTLRELGARGVILDLRGNGGGVVSEALKLAAAWVGGGPLGYERDAQGQLHVLRAANPQPDPIDPLVLLIDAGSASMAEVFAGAIQDRGRGLILGQRSYGKGLGQTLVLLSSPLGDPEGAVEVTDRAFYRLDGSALAGRGVSPDVELPFSAGTAEPARANAPSWLPARVDPLEPGALQRITPDRIEHARSALRNATGDDLDRVLAIAAAHVAETVARLRESGPRP